jgi:hypothetical protein
MIIGGSDGASLLDTVELFNWKTKGKMPNSHLSMNILQCGVISKYNWGQCYKDNLLLGMPYLGV